jgi:hypothetical protein
LIGRIRKDAKLSHPLPPNPKPNQLYGPDARTPEELLKDDSIPTLSVKVFIAGKVQEIKLKTVDSIFWRRAGHDRPLLLILIKPLGYRLSKASKLLYRQPAFLISTDPNLPLQSIIQAYVYRWEIECNHRDEKSFIGVAQGQVRSPMAVSRLPQFQVAAYSLLLLASLLSYGFDRGDHFLPLPKWRRSTPPRPSILDHLNLLRSFLFDRAACSSHPPDHFASTTLHNTNCPDLDITPTRLALPTC